MTKSSHLNYFYARAELRRLFCTFVDYSKAFDSINRATLWKKLFTFIDVIMNMYKSIKSCVMDSGIVRFMGHPKMVGGPTVTQWIQEFDMYARMMLLMF